MTRFFSFAEGDRKYECRVERAAGRTESWGGFEVSGDRHRYAPFHAEASDTDTSVRGRIVSYYSNLLARRSEPASSWHNRGKWRAGAGTGSAGGEETPS